MPWSRRRGAMISSRLELPSASRRCSRGRMRGPEGMFLTDRARYCGPGVFWADVDMSRSNRLVWAEVGDYCARLEAELHVSLGAKRQLGQHENARGVGVAVVDPVALVGEVEDVHVHLPRAVLPGARSVERVL